MDLTLQSTGQSKGDTQITVVTCLAVRNDHLIMFDWGLYS